MKRVPQSVYRVFAIMPLMLATAGAFAHGAGQNPVVHNAPTNLCPSTGLLVIAARSANAPREIELSSRAIEQREALPHVGYARLEGADATVAWLVDENGVKTVDRGDRRQDLMAQRAILCNDVKPIATSTEGEFTAQTPEGLIINVLRDSDGRIGRAIYTAGEETHTIRIAYATLPNGGAYPASWTIDNEMPVTAVQAAVQRGVIAQPSTVAWATHVSRGTGAAPMSARDQRFAVPCQVDDRIASCVLDTGGAGFMVSSDLAKFEPGTVTAVSLNTWSGALMGRRGRIQSLRIAGSVFTKPVVLEDARLAAGIVIVGRDYFQTNRVRLDMARHQLVNDSQQRPCLAGCVRVSIWQVPTGTVSVDGHPTNVLFDTGSAYAMKVPTAFVGGSGAPSGGRCASARVTTVALGGLATTTSLCPLVDHSGYPFSVGAPLFGQFREVMIDYPNNEFQFIK